MPDKLVLAYSGGLDTSVAIRWLHEEQGYEVIALTVDVGQERDLSAVKRRAEATQEAASAVAHGSTGKGNDQVRFDVSVQALAPDLRILAPVREWGMTREEEIDYARRHRIPVPVTKESPYSIDENLWGRSIECGVLADPWQEPPDA